MFELLQDLLTSCKPWTLSFLDYFKNLTKIDSAPRGFISVKLDVFLANLCNQTYRFTQEEAVVILNVLREYYDLALYTNTSLAKKIEDNLTSALFVPKSTKVEGLQTVSCAMAVYIISTNLYMVEKLFSFINLIHDKDLVEQLLRQENLHPYCFIELIYCLVMSCSKVFSVSQTFKKLIKNNLMEDESSSNDVCTWLLIILQSVKGFMSTAAPNIKTNLPFESTLVYTKNCSSCNSIVTHKEDAFAIIDINEYATYQIRNCKGLQDVIHLWKTSCENIVNKYSCSKCKKSKMFLSIQLQTFTEDPDNIMFVLPKGNEIPYKLTESFIFSLVEAPYLLVTIICLSTKKYTLYYRQPFINKWMMRSGNGMDEVMLLTPAKLSNGDVVASSVIIVYQKLTAIRNLLRTMSSTYENENESD